MLYRNPNYQSILKNKKLFFYQLFWKGIAINS